ncbi:MAG: S8 family serine peptidase [Acidimicrobiales bacterium]
MGKTTASLRRRARRRRIRAAGLLVLTMLVAVSATGAGVGASDRAGEEPDAAGAPGAGPGDTGPLDDGSTPTDPTDPTDPTNPTRPGSATDGANPTGATGPTDGGELPVGSPGDASASRPAAGDPDATGDELAGPTSAKPAGPPPLSAVGGSQVGSGGSVILDPIVDATPGPGTPVAEDYLVLYGLDASPTVARALVVAAGGAVRAEKPGIGLAWVRSSAADFPLKLMGLGEAPGIIAGVARDRIIGSSAPDATASPPFPTATLGTPPAPVVIAGPTMPAGMTAAWAGEPLATTQWALSMVGIPTQRGASGEPVPLPQAVLGRSEVLVGIIDTGIDGTHPDLSSRLDRTRSRNFTIDIPALDGACAEEPDASCTDAVDVDENGHGTHVAAIAGAAVNGFGMAGVAPGATLVNLRAGQDSGYFFLGPATSALLYAADIGVDVVNLSFFLDPWLYNCAANPGDNRAEQVEQVTTIAVMQRAVDYARDRGVTVVAALGNEHVDLANKVTDVTSPNFPPGDSRTRNVDSACLDVPAELQGVIGVTSVGPTLRKADYANYGLGRSDLAAPGGWRRDRFGTEDYRAVSNEILSAWPAAVAQAEIAGNGNKMPDNLVEHCVDEHCAYYRYLQGTSMAAPHVTGVAALVISLYGSPSAGQISLQPFIVETLLNVFAADLACPPSGSVSYADVGRPAEYDAICTTEESGRNSFYGEGLVNAAPLIDSIRLSMIP